MLIPTVVLPSLRRSSLHHTVGDGAVWLAFETPSGTLYLHIREVAAPSLLWLRYFPDQYVGPADVQLLVAGLSVNRFSWMLKVGCDPEDGELVIDVEIPLLHGQVTEESFTTYLRSSTAAVVDLLDLLARVRSGAITAVEAARALRRGPQIGQGGGCSSRAEREAEEIIHRSVDGTGA